MQNACCTFPPRGVRSLRSITPRTSRPMPSKVRTVELVDVGVAEVRVEVDADVERRFLEERIVVVPRSQRVDRARRSVATSCSSRPAFNARNGAAVICVDLVERGEQALLVEVGRGERQREVVAETERAGRVVAQPRRGRADRRRPRPRRSSTRPTPPSRCSVSSLVRRIVEDLVVVDRLAVDRAAVARETRLDIAPRARRSGAGGRPRPGSACTPGRVPRVGGRRADRGPARCGRAAPRRTRRRRRARRTARHRQRRGVVGSRRSRRRSRSTTRRSMRSPAAPTGRRTRRRGRRRSLEPDALVAAAHRVHEEHDEQDVEREVDDHRHVTEAAQPAEGCEHEELEHCGRRSPARSPTSSRSRCRSRRPRDRRG